MAGPQSCSVACRTHALAARARSTVSGSIFEWEEVHKHSPVPIRLTEGDRERNHQNRCEYTSTRSCEQFISHYRTQGGSILQWDASPGQCFPCAY
eukprot:3558194-Prymnesium_polylepis.1